MSRNVFFFFVSPFFRLAGAKVTFIFVLTSVLKSFLKNNFFAFYSIFLSVSQGTLRVLRGAKITSVFKYHKLFRPFLKINSQIQFSKLVSIYMNVNLIAGAKVVCLFSLTTPFLIFFESIF